MTANYMSMVLNSITGNKKECVMNDLLSSEMIDRLLLFVDYDIDVHMPEQSSTQ